MSACAILSTYARVLRCALQTAVTMRLSRHAVQRCSEEDLGTAHQRCVAKVVWGALPGPWLQASARQCVLLAARLQCVGDTDSLCAHDSKSQQRRERHPIAQLAQVSVCDRARKRVYSASRPVLARQRLQSPQHCSGALLLDRHLLRSHVSTNVQPC